MGVTTQASATRPFLLFREKTGNAVLPVVIHPIDAAVAIAEMDQQMVSPHDMAVSILEAASVQPEQCLFLDGEGATSYMEVRFKENKLKPMRFPTEFAMSFCLRSKMRFFCSKAFFESSRELQFEVVQQKGALEQMQRPRYLN